MSRPGKKRSRARKAVEPAAPVHDLAADLVEEPTFEIPHFFKWGVVVFFLVACAFGVLEVHSSTDTWIGFMAGKQVFAGDFPDTDTFSYTRTGETWFNQNWLSHVYLWLLYDWFGPNAVVYGTWALGVATFAFVMLAVRLRCDSWTVAIAVGALMGVGSRSWLSARPATVQFFLLALCWLCLQALISQGARRRWWPIVLLFVIFAGWTHAHGSFVFGYALVAMLLGCAWGLVGFPALVGDTIGGRLNARQLLTGEPATIRGFRAILNHGQAFAIAGVAILTAIMGVVLSPYGLDNFTHPLEVAESDEWRTVGEWHPPFRQANYPPVGRFWAIYAIAIMVPVTIMLLRGFKRADRTPAGMGHMVLICRVLDIGAAISLAGLLMFMVWPVFGDMNVFPYVDLDAKPRFDSKYPYLIMLGLALALPHVLGMLWKLPQKLAAPKTKSRDAAGHDGRASSLAFIHMFDLAAVGLGIFMVLFARRFAPIFYILAAPAMVVWLMRLWRDLSGVVRPIGQGIALVAIYVGIVLTVASAWARGSEQLVRNPARFEGEWNLLDRVVVHYRSPIHTARFLRENNLTPNVMTEWTAAAPLAFEAPGVKVFIDGRAQQVYTLELYGTYRRLMAAPPGREYERETSQILIDHGTDAVVLRQTRNAARLRATLMRSPDWVLVFGATNEMMYARRGSDFLRELMDRERAGDLEWPDMALTNVARGTLLMHMSPPNVVPAVEFWQRAVQQELRLGVDVYWNIARYTAGTPLARAMQVYFAQQRDRVEEATGLRDELRAQLLGRLDRCQRLLQDNPGPTGQPD